MVLPAPLAPSTSTSWPGATAKSTSRKIRHATDPRADLSSAITTRPPRGGGRRLKRRAEVGLHDARVLLHLARGTVRDPLTMVEHGHAIGKLHDEVHVVLDQEDRRAGIPDAPDNA